MIGHSVGELAAACIAGVFSLEAGLQIVAERGRLIQSMPGGSMTAVPLPESQVIPLLNGKLSLASVNGDEQCVVSGPDDAIGDLEKSLADKGMEYHRLRVSHAFHSSMMDPILREFAEFVRKFDLAPPRIPYISSSTGNWITDAEATDPDYWASTAAPDGSIRGRHRRRAEDRKCDPSGNWSRQYVERLVRAESRVLGFA